MKLRFLFPFIGLIIPLTTTLASATEPEYMQIQGHKAKRIFGSLIEIEGWKGKIPQAAAFLVWKREPVIDKLNRQIWIAVTVGREKPDLKTVFSVEGDKYKNVYTEALRYVYDCRKNRARAVELVRTSGPFKTGKTVYRTTEAKDLSFKGEWIPFNGYSLDSAWQESHLVSEDDRANLEIMWEETCGRASRGG